MILFLRCPSGRPTFSRSSCPRALRFIKPTLRCRNHVASWPSETCGSGRMAALRQELPFPSRSNAPRAPFDAALLLGKPSGCLGHRRTSSRSRISSSTGTGNRSPILARRDHHVQAPARTRSAGPQATVAPARISRPRWDRSTTRAEHGATVVG